MSFTKDVPSKNGVIQSFHEDESNVIPLLVFQTESTAPTDSNEVSESLVENDKIIFDELKTLIFQGYSENLLEKLIEFPNFPLNAQNDTDQYYTLLHHAAEKKSVDCLRILVRDFSAKTNIQADNGWTPIHLVVTSGNKLLLYFIRTYTVIRYLCVSYRYMIYMQMQNYKSKNLKEFRM